ncbi:unnamed protein product [Peniophora sp. CBMAI 1063]|nr:unnamed protein product [Peniophora sp. CBMAI 1063]
MPGTLLYPTNSSLVTEPSSPPSSPLTEAWNPDVPSEDAQPQIVSTPLRAPSSRPFVRSVSITAWQNFLDGLDRIATQMPVSVYIVPAADVERLQPSAGELGFRTGIVMPANIMTEKEALLVVGTEGAAVTNVCERLSKEGADMAKTSGTCGLAQVAGGAIVGAAVLMAGLAL